MGQVVTVALDAMGGDLGVEATMKGAARISLEEADLRVMAVGDVEAMARVLDDVSHDPRRIRLVASKGVVRMEDSPRRALEALPDCSILTAARLVEEGGADALVSAGNTGALVLACASTFRLIDGIPRAALASVYPTERRHGPRQDPFALILDVGATVNADADALVGFALMGSAYSSVISEIEAPRVALLSNGTEPGKGTPAIVEAHRRLVSAPIAFHGNIEGLDIPVGSVDVVVCDGFLGNVVLKMLEGIGEMIQGGGPEGVRGAPWRLALQMMGGRLADLKRLTDWKGYGGAPLLGFDRLAIKAHGRSEAGAMRNAIKVAAKAVRGDFRGRVERAVAALRRPAVG